MSTFAEIFTVLFVLAVIIVLYLLRLHRLEKAEERREHEELLKAQQRRDVIARELELERLRKRSIPKPTPRTEPWIAPFPAKSQQPLPVRQAVKKAPRVNTPVTRNEFNPAPTVVYVNNGRSDADRFVENALVGAVGFAIGRATASEREETPVFSSGGGGDFGGGGASSSWEDSSPSSSSSSYDSGSSSSDRSSSYNSND